MRAPADYREFRPAGGARHVTIFFSDIAAFSDLARKIGDAEAARVANEVLTLQEIVITRDGAGQVLQFGGDSVFAVFDQASVALNCALEIQRLITASAADHAIRLRIGLHMGEVLLRQGERVEIISRHVNRAHRVMEAAAPGQILASDAVVDAGRDFLDIPGAAQAIEFYGEYNLKGVGPTNLCEVADLRFRKPVAPKLEGHKPDSAVLGRLELAGYRPMSRLGEGASGVVYKAQRDGATAPVAIKVLSPLLCQDPVARERFLQEAERTKQLAVHGLVRVLDVKLDHQPPFFVMELLMGHPLDVALEGASAERIAKTFREICSILDELHSQGLIHCDLKPGNILITPEETPVLLDLGVSVFRAKTQGEKTASTGALGTPAYLAPELIEGRDVGPYTDIYSLGVLLFKALTGREPFRGESVHEVIQGHLHEDPPMPATLRAEVPDGLQRICLKALEKKPGERYLNAREMGEDLDRFLRGETVRTRPTLYDNLLFHRVSRHVEQVREWTRRGLLNTEEQHKLLSSYEGLQRRGLPAVMEGRFYRLFQTLVYVGGWAVINGALLWLMQHWNTLTRTGKLLLGSVPVLTTFVLAAAMWKLERFRLCFVALIVAILAVPLFTGVWLYEFKVAASVPESALALEVFHQKAESTAMTNRQLWLTSLVAAIVAAAVMWFTRTVTHSAQTVLMGLALYTTTMLPQNLVPNVMNEQWAALALKYLPLLLITSFIAGLLVRNKERQYQAPPWIYLSVVLLLGIGYALSLHGLQEWTTLEKRFHDALSYVLLSLTGLVQTVLGLVARRHLGHHCRLATWIVIFAGLVNLLAGLGFAGTEETWPQTWWRPEFFGRAVPAPHVALPAASLLVTVLACRYQLFAFLLVGLAGFAGSIHTLGYLYFGESPAWPRVMMLAGAVCFFGALLFELRRTRGNTIDDVVNEKRL